MTRRALLTVLLTSLLFGCDVIPRADVDAGPGDVLVRDAGPPDPTFGPEDRRSTVVLPAAHDGTTPLPMVVLLHGYGVTSRFQNLYFQLDAATRDRGVYLLLAESSVDSAGFPFWNATDACCNFDGSDVDDVAMLDALIDEVSAALPIDPRRIYLFGHSNGGFMSYRMACERGERFAGAAILAGDDYLDPTACVPSTGVSILHLHGDHDTTIPIEGGSTPPFGSSPSLPPFPAARTSVERWAGYAGCDAMPVAGTALDLVVESEGHPMIAETAVLDFAGCDDGLGVSFWTLRDEGHTPTFDLPFAADAVLDWLLEHER